MNVLQVLRHFQFFVYVFWKKSDPLVTVFSTYLILWESNIWLRLGLSHVREHKFLHHFNDTLNPLCPCNSEVELVFHFFLHCHFFDNERIILMNEILNIDPDINLLDDISISNLLLYGSKKYSNEIIKKILEISIKYILTSNRFEGPLFWKDYSYIILLTPCFWKDYSYIILLTPCFWNECKALWWLLM